MHLQNSATGLEKGANALIFYFSGTSGGQIVPKMQNSLIIQITAVQEWIILKEKNYPLNHAMI